MVPDERCTTLVRKLASTTSPLSTYIAAWDQWRPWRTAFFRLKPWPAVSAQPRTPGSQYTSTMLPGRQFEKLGIYVPGQPASKGSKLEECLDPAPTCGTRTVSVKKLGVQDAVELLGDLAADVETFAQLRELDACCCPGQTVQLTARCQDVRQAEPLENF